MNVLAWIAFLAAACLEVGGDAVVRHGLRSARTGLVVAGALMLGLYGITVNMVRWDFSKLLGVYVAVFALVSFLFGAFLFKETISLARWMGLGLILVGALVIQFSR